MGASRAAGQTSLRARLVISLSQFANRHGVYLGRRSTRVHVALYRRSAGKLGGHVPGLPQARILLLDHTGARSGVRRTSPVMYHRDRDVLAIAARVATEQERERLWPQFVAFYPGFEAFQRHARGRTIPIVILDPR